MQSCAQRRKPTGSSDISLWKIELGGIDFTIEINAKEGQG
jgi:hypothetical protein